MNLATKNMELCKSVVRRPKIRKMKNYTYIVRRSTEGAGAGVFRKCCKREIFFFFEKAYVG